MVSFESFVKAMPPSLSELKVLPSFCFAFKIPDDVTVTNIRIICICTPNRRAVRNKRAGGKIVSKSINVQTKIRQCRGKFFLKINKRADQNKAVHIGWNRRAGGISSQNQ